jgi:hypothetical protein
MLKRAPPEAPFSELLGLRNQIGGWLDLIPTTLAGPLGCPDSKFHERGERAASLRATSHARLRARDHCTSSTLIGGKGGAGPSSLHT